MKRPYESLYNRFLKIIKRNGYITDITYDDFLNFTKNPYCHYCKDGLKWSKYNIGLNSVAYNLDRKDNDIGYLKSNCVPCCWDCNETKSDKFTYQEFMNAVQFRCKTKNKLDNDRDNFLIINGFQE